mmetsp:Transcript_92683/g.198693  ORF Transcript_92683/g.198693 Transcript_92683/m.198693 type:complete len:82 (+) Transcript_92683:167-412(+)
MLFFLCHLFLSPVQTKEWKSHRQVKAAVKTMTSLSFFLILTLMIQEDTAIFFRLLRFNAGSDSICFMTYLALHKAKIKVLW